MGALHEGHAALIRRARRKAGPSGNVVVSIFVNPTQFGPKEDFSRYPRPFSADRDLCARLGVDILFHPDAAAMYPTGFSTYVQEEEVGMGLCGGSRPGHFRGVCTVVLKLFHIVQPDAAIFGLKDFQQCMVLQRMVRDLNLPVQMIFAPTVRESDGLALSSRNQYLSAPERAQAPILRAAILEARKAWRGGVTAARSLLSVVQKRIAAAPLARTDYIAFVDAATLQPVTTVRSGDALALAVFFGKTRLIDNLIFS